MRGVRFAGLLGMTVLAGALVGCVDDQIVYRDKPMFEDPPQAAVGFLGYSNQATKQTTCGNCHKTQQLAWADAKHATAWEDLKANSFASETCNDCHTVSNLGNDAGAVKVAYSATQDPRYEDVQCESCHGAGLDHVNDPSSLTKKPFASIVTAEDETDGCGGCHTDDHHPFVKEWEGSLHGEVNETVAEEAVSNPASYASCLDCHEGKAALKNTFKVTDTYAEQSDGKMHGITCAVCHDPHGNKNTAQLRLEASSHVGTTNLCYQCHQRRPVPSGTTSRNSPHSPQGPIVLGDAVGYRPPNMTTNKIISTHGSESNKELCATCHVASYALNAAGTVNTTGHTFKAIPCKDANGIVTSAEDCQMTARSYKSCLGSGCHGTEAAARSAIESTEARLTYLSTELKRLVALAKLTDKGKVDWKSDAVVSPLEGADFNSTIMEHDLSRGAHNPFLVDALLTNSISYVKSYYGVN